MTQHSHYLDLNGKCRLKLITPRRMKIHFICLFEVCLVFSSCLFVLWFVGKHAYYESRHPRLSSRDPPPRRQVSASDFYVGLARDVFSRRSSGGRIAASPQPLTAQRLRASPELQGQHSWRFAGCLRRSCCVAARRDSAATPG